MEGIADFLDSLIGGVDLIFYSMLVGGLLWANLLLRPWQKPHDYNPLMLQKVIALIFKAACFLAFAQLFKVVLKIWLMTAILDRWPFPEIADTVQFQGGLVRMLLTLSVAYYCHYFLKQNPYSKSHWRIAAYIAIPMIISGAWLVHGAGRFENRYLLMFLTVAHQVAAAAWIGGVFQLVNVWLLHQRKDIPAHLWPQFLKSFSPFGIAGVILLLGTGVPMAFQYIDSINGFIGTGYGNLLMVKIILLGLALGFALLNRKAIKQFQLTGNNYALNHRVPYYIEAETFVLVTLLFTAASLASQPPASDIPNLTASWQDVVGTFTPRVPRTQSPTHEELLAGEAGRVAIIGQVPSPAATAWSDYNHNISGIFLTVMSFFAMLSYAKRLPSAFSLFDGCLKYTRYWPFGFVALGVFLFFRSDAESWPLGPIGFWESTFNNGEVLQHRIATLLVFVLGILELQARKSKNANTHMPYFFPILAAFGGLMLLTHSHVGFQPKSAFLIQVGHTMMGVMSLILACGRWLELKLDKPGKDIAGFVSVAALFLIGLILMFYREPLY
ncbi:MAG: CopD family protein [Methylicorpusculum sp.]|uniref:copper resistance D family protein n=1 Tax=Methylicorpusculum sp. TaxID=2713644 RepID=UPI00271FD597|nr:CopD family protein [Methylicorpusculum sp.]MDO8846471.1 CopD family protein [Methylicorpusculum sp.]MDO8939441.1 CopD family protein [Methylicorpusculum sp.]MDP2200666.1 CopD family protein [Methylicorpusculum sp.]